MLTADDALAVAWQHRRAGRYRDAEEVYRRLLRDDPDNADVLCHLGATLRDRQAYAESVAVYRQAAELIPDRPEVHNSLGIVHACWRRFAEAETHFRQAIALRPNYAKALNNLGNALSEQRKLDEAAAAYQQARAAGYADPGLDDSLGQVLARQGELTEAAVCFRRVLAVRPEDPSVLTRLAVVLARQGELESAADAMRRALRRPAVDADVHFRLGDALTDKGKLDLAVKCYHTALQTAPNDPVLLNHLATAHLQQGDLEAAAANFRRAVAVRPEDQWSRSSLLFLRTNDPAADPEDLFEEHVEWAERHAPALATPPTFTNDRTPDRILRIGYISPDFRRHPVGRFLESVLAAHAPNRVEIYCYDEAIRPPDEVTDRLRARARHWRIIKDRPHAAVADQVRSDKIDILVDLAGHTGNNRLGVLALRPAPVQVTYLGYPNTTGIGAIDYVLVDPVTQPADEPALFVEEPVRLAGGFCCYAPRDDAPLPPPLPARTRGHVTFGAFHNLSKINGPVLDLWARVLDAVPGSKLCVGRNTLSGETAERLRRQLAAHGIADDRLELKQLVAGPAAFLEAYLDVDIALDTFPWTGHTTACDSLWMGVPVVTLHGRTHAGRMVASVLTYTGLTDWIAGTPEEYIDIARRRASDLDRLAELRSGLRERMRASKLCDATGFTRQLEDTYRRMWARWCARGPEPATVIEALNHGEQLRGAGRHPAAEDAYRIAVRRDPFRPEAWTGLAAAVAAQGRLEEAVGLYRRAVTLRPQDPRTHNNLGIVQARLLRYPAAEASFREALDLHPEHAKGWNNLGNVLSEQGRLDEAATAYRNAERHGYRDAALACNLAIVSARQGFRDQAAESFRTALAIDPSNVTAQSSLLFLRNYDPEADADELFAEHVRWGKRHERPLAPIKVWDRSTYRPLRIGYVSPDFRNHPVGRFIEPVLAAHAPAKVEVYCYDEAPFPPDAVTARLRGRVRNWRVTRGMSSEQVAERIRTDGIDILVDLAGHTAHNRLDVLALKPAPVQVTYLGYPNTTGLAAVDYVLVDAVTLPEGEPRRFVEEPFRLAGGFSCFAPRDDAPTVGPLPAERTGRVTFGSTHGLIKLNDAVLDLWAAVLRAVPDARLRIVRDMLTGAAREHFRKAFIERGIAEDRVELVSPPPGAGDYFRVYDDIDISLDAFPWTGHTTACESLWMGVPVLTLCGSTHAGRMVASVLTQAGLEDWIAGSREELVERARDRAADRAGLARLRGGLREQLRRSPLCDTVAFTRRLEAAYRTMWKRWVRATARATE